MIVGKEDIPVAHHQSYYGIRLNFNVIVIGQRKFDIHRHICHSVVLKKEVHGLGQSHCYSFLLCGDSLL